MDKYVFFWKTMELCDDAIEIEYKTENMDSVLDKILNCFDTIK